MKHRIGPQMAKAVAYIKEHQGCSIFPVARHLHGWRRGHKYGYRAVHRAIKAGLITYTSGVGNAYSLWA